MSDPAEGPSNHHEAFEEYLRGLPNPRGRKLSFSDKCGIAYALHRGEKITVICEAFALSRATASNLRHALEPGRKHYGDVRAELERLGQEPFKEKYFTLEFNMRLQRVRRGLTHLDETGRDLAPRTFGPDQYAKKYAGEHTLEDGSIWHVDWRPEGWRIKPVHPEAQDYWGEERGITPCRTSAEAFDLIYELNGWPTPRPKPGRPKK